MIELSINQRVSENEVRTICIMRIDETDPAAEVEVLQPPDGRTVAAVRRAFRQLHEDAQKAAAAFGDDEA